MFATSRQPCLRTFMVIFPLRRILFVPRIDVKKHCILSYLCEVRAVKVRLRCVQWAIFAPSAFRPASAAPEVYCETLRGRRPGIISRRSSLLYRFFFIRCFDNVFRDIFVSFSLLYALFTPFPSSLVLFLSIRMAEIGKALSKGERELWVVPILYPFHLSLLLLWIWAFI